MGFINRIGDLFKSDEDFDDTEGFENYDEEEEAEAAPAPAQQPKAAPAPARATGAISSGAALEMKVVKPERFEEVKSIGEHLLARRTVVLNLEETNKETARRLIDFLNGVAYAINGDLRKVATNTYVVTPSNVELSGEKLSTTQEAAFTKE